MRVVHALSTQRDDNENQGRAGGRNKRLEEHLVYILSPLFLSFEREDKKRRSFNSSHGKERQLSTSHPRPRAKLIALRINFALSNLGPIPRELCELTSIKILCLEHNALTGERRC